MDTVEIVTEEKSIAAYSPILNQLATIKANNASIVFDYEDPADNKKARSYVHQLRKLKALTDRERKAAKAESLAYGRRVDSEAKKITVEIEEMIDVHAVPIAAIEQREADRIALIKNKIEVLSMLPDSEVAEVSDYSRAIVELETWTVVDGSFEEFALEAAAVKEETLKKLRALLESARKREAEKTELDRLRKEAEERAQADRDERIRKEAKEKAEAAAEVSRLKTEAEKEATHKREIEASKRRELELKLEREKAEREKAEAVAKAERIGRETEERIAKEAEQKRLAEKARIAARLADEKLKAHVNAEIKEALKTHGLHEAGIDLLIGLVSDGKIPHMAINY